MASGEGSILLWKPALLLPLDYIERLMIYSRLNKAPSQTRLCSTPLIPDVEFVGGQLDDGLHRFFGVFADRLDSDFGAARRSQGKNAEEGLRIHGGVLTSQSDLGTK